MIIWKVLHQSLVSGWHFQTLMLVVFWLVSCGREDLLSLCSDKHPRARVVSCQYQALLCLHSESLPLELDKWCVMSQREASLSYDFISTFNTILL